MSDNDATVQQLQHSIIVTSDAMAKMRDTMDAYRTARGEQYNELLPLISDRPKTCLVCYWAHIRSTETTDRYVLRRINTHADDSYMCIIITCESEGTVSASVLDKCDNWSRAQYNIQNPGGIQECLQNISKVITDHYIPLYDDMLVMNTIDDVLVK